MPNAWMWRPLSVLGSFWFENVMLILTLVGSFRPGWTKSTLPMINDMPACCNMAVGSCCCCCCWPCICCSCFISCRARGGMMRPLTSAVARTGKPDYWYFGFIVDIKNWWWEKIWMKSLIKKNFTWAWQALIKTAANIMNLIIFSFFFYLSLKLIFFLFQFVKFSLSLFGLNKKNSKLQIFLLYLNLSSFFISIRFSQSLFLLFVSKQRLQKQHQQQN